MEGGGETYVHVRARGLSATRKMHEVHAGASVCACASVVGVVAVCETACEPSGLLRSRLGAAFWRQVLPDQVRLPPASRWAHHHCLHPHLQPRHEHGYIMRGPGRLCQLHRSVATPSLDTYYTYRAICCDRSSCR